MRFARTRAAVHWCGIARHALLSRHLHATHLPVNDMEQHGRQTGPPKIQPSAIKQFSSIFIKCCSRCVVKLKMSRQLNLVYCSQSPVF